MKVVLFLGCVLFLVSCLDDPDCIRNADTALVVQFKRLADGKNDTVVFYRVEAIGADSVFYGQSPDVLDTLKGTPVRIAVNPFVDSTKFVFHFPFFQRHLVVRYQRSVRYLGEDCGSEVNFSKLKIAHTDFDSVRVVNPVLSKARTVNVEIYR